MFGRSTETILEGFQKPEWTIPVIPPGKVLVDEALVAKVREAVRQYRRCERDTPFALCAAMDDLIIDLPAE